MPIRFQVDGDFYDHPKTIDLSDAAVALWTRAGSYSTHKHLDGFVPDGMLARLSTNPTEASAELVRARLWRRVRGGHQFHEWDERNLTKDEIDSDREYERERKRRYRMTQRETIGAPTKRQRRAIEGQLKGRRGDFGESDIGPVDNSYGGTEPQVANGSVPPGHGRDSPGTSTGTPSVSVSVSESVSVSGSGHGAGPSPTAGTATPGRRPPDTCKDHKDDPDPPACRRCKSFREAAEAWDAAYAVRHAMTQARQRDTRPQCPKHRGQLAHNCAPCRAEQLAPPPTEETP